MELSDSTIFVGLVVGLTQVVKDLGLLDSKYLPLVAVVIGVGIVYFPVTSLLVKGGVIGLTAAGLFSTSKEILQK